ncbi:hypothetical protein BDD12DRAFT_863532 [Trichophaea hybrida]|nr:hypothetical protein BDD12DRAFT_863532 [Trichophaea hybrida]
MFAYSSISMATISKKTTYSPSHSRPTVANPKLQPNLQTPLLLKTLHSLPPNSRHHLTMYIPILLLLFQFLTLISATNNTTHPDHAFHQCQTLGIDVYGDIPLDYHSSDEVSYSFASDSIGALWIAAQASIHFDLRLRKRQLTGYSFATWSDPRDCKGNVVYYPEVYLNKYYWDKFHDNNMNTFQIIKGDLNIDTSCRVIRLQSWQKGTQNCKDIFSSVWGKTGDCFPGVQTFTCFRVQKDC